jgi:hypothetical protein
MQAIVKKERGFRVCGLSTEYVATAKRANPVVFRFLSYLRAGFPMRAICAGRIEANMAPVIVIVMGV